MRDLMKDLAVVMAYMNACFEHDRAIDFVNTHHVTIQQNAEAALRLRKGWDAEVDDVDKIIGKLGMTVEQARTEGGCLHLPHVLNHIQETLDALAEAHGLASAMSEKYVNANLRIKALEQACKECLSARSVELRANELLREWVKEKGDE